MDVRIICIFGILIVSGCKDPKQSNPTDSLETKRTTGKELYLQRCTVCHGTDGKLGASGAKDLSVTKLNESEIREIILEGKNAMPPFEHQIESEVTLNEMVEFVKSLSK